MSTNTKYWLEPIDPVVGDTHTVYHSHNIYTHLGCVLLRCIIGILIIWSQSRKSNKFKLGWIILCVLVVIIFLSKFISRAISNEAIWKVYMRTVLSYALAGFAIQHDRYDHAGMIVIVDALMGLQSRHTAFISSYITKQNKKKDSA